jgi:hypothetical protein
MRPFQCAAFQLASFNILRIEMVGKLVNKGIPQRKGVNVMNNVTYCIE